MKNSGSLNPSNTAGSSSKPDNAEIILCTFNARYSHAALGLRYLAANMGSLEESTAIVEFTISHDALEAAEKLLSRKPRIIGFGVYIWNSEVTLQTIRILKSIAPELCIVIGGPEVSYEFDEQAICALADYVITGAADQRFAELCKDVLSGQRPEGKIQSALPLKLEQLKLPYSRYTDEDLKNRIIYVEASRGCPFKCEFCLSSLDKTAVPFPLGSLLVQLQSLYERGARHFKFVDRTFNLKVDSCLQILDFFLDLKSDDLFLHFELIPDRLPERLKEKIQQFPEGQLQFEIGIQSFNQEVQALISRRQDMQKTIDNMQWLTQHSKAHIHADLIFGLPGETLASFADGFDQLVRLAPDEIQLGLLKRLRGTPIERHSKAYQMRYQTQPPYRLLCNSTMDFQTVQRIARMARYWDLVANSGRFNTVLPHVLAEQPFYRFLNFADWLYRETGQTHQIALARLFRLLATWLSENPGTSPGVKADSHPNQTPPAPESLMGVKRMVEQEALAEDCQRAGFDLSVIGSKASRSNTNAVLSPADKTLSANPASGTASTSGQSKDPSSSTHQKRQRRHLAATSE